MPKTKKKKLKILKKLLDTVLQDISYRSEKLSSTDSVSA